MRRGSVAGFVACVAGGVAGFVACVEACVICCMHSRARGLSKASASRKQPVATHGGFRRGAGGAKRWLVIGRRKYRIHEMLGLPPSAPREHVRTAYLEALLREHPDHNIEDPQASTSRLIALNDAWQCYRQAHRDDDAVDSEGFTAFGVGCSFSDGPEERTQRVALMEEASRRRGLAVGHVAHEELASGLAPNHLDRRSANGIEKAVDAIFIDCLHRSSALAAWWRSRTNGSHIEDPQPHTGLRSVSH